MDKRGLLTRLEWSVCVGATLAAVWLHMSFWRHAGGLWRDEVTSVHIATVGTTGEMWRMLRYESFPALFLTVLRFWSSLGFGATDFALRGLGFLAGLSLLATLWVNARILRCWPPLLSLALLATNMTVVRWGDSLRAYGFGCALILLTFALIWLLITKPSVLRFGGAALGAVLSVQCLYQNAFLVLGICLGACFVCFRRQQERVALLVVGVGALAAVSLLPYLGIMLDSQKSFIVERTGFNAGVVWQTWADALGNPWVWQIPFWVALVLAGWVRGFVFLPAISRKKPVGDEDLPLFAAITSAFCVVLFVLFIAMTRLPTTPWYWLPPMVLVAVCSDVALRDFLARHQPWALAVVALLVFLPFIADLGDAKQRQTTIDRIAARLRQQARPNDLILVYPWYCGVTFSHYYRGSTPWVTLPALSDFRVTRYDLLKEKLAASAPIQPVVDQMMRTLASGGQLWIVGKLPPAPPDETEVPDLPPAPEGPQGWFDVPYTYVWGRQVEHLFATQRLKMEPVDIDFGAGANIYEDSPLAVIRNRATSGSQ